MIGFHTSRQFYYVIGSFILIEFHQNVVASNIYFWYQNNLLEIWHDYCLGYLGGNSITFLF